MAAHDGQPQDRAAVQGQWPCGNVSTFAALRRSTATRRRWALSPSDELTISRQIARVAACVPASLDSTPALSLADVGRLLALIATCPPTAERALARALLSAAVGFQARWSELYRARETDLSLHAGGAVLSVVSCTALVRHHLIMAPHFGGQLEIAGLFPLYGGGAKRHRPAAAAPSATTLRAEKLAPRA